MHRTPKVVQEKHSDINDLETEAHRNCGRLKTEMKCLSIHFELNSTSCMQRDN